MGVCVCVMGARQVYNRQDRQDDEVAAALDIRTACMRAFPGPKPETKSEQDAYSLTDPWQDPRRFREYFEKCPHATSASSKACASEVFGVSATAASRKPVGHDA